MFMSKKALSVTLDEQNLLWLRGLAAADGGRHSVSQAIDRIISEARLGGRGPDGAIRSVVGTIDLDTSDPQLDRADAVLRAQFNRSLVRPLQVRETGSPYDPQGERRARKTRHARTKSGRR